MADASTSADAEAILDLPSEVCDPFGLDICFDVPTLNPVLTEERNETETAKAIGILTGSGDDEVTNTGIITVDASSPGACPSEICTRTLSSVGIETGDGNDTVVNAGSGSITATINDPPGPFTAAVNSVQESGIGIDTGAGNDLVRLLDQSVVNSVIRLGDGDDVVAFAGEAAAVVIQGGDGRDTLRLEDRRMLELAPGQIIETERFEVDQGIMVFNSDLPLNDFRTELYDDGYGQMTVNGQAFIDVEDSEIIVIARPQVYVDKQLFDVLMGDTFNGTFATETLTESRFLSFDVNYLPTEVQVEANVLPFVSAANNRVQRAVGGYLDLIAPTAKGDLAEVIGTFQLFPSGSDFDAAFSGLSPDSHDNYTQATFFAMSQYNETLSRRMRALRIDSMVPGAAGHQSRFVTDRSLQLAYNGDSSEIRSLYADEEMVTPTWWRNVWGTAFGQWGDQDGDNGYTGFEYNVEGLALGIDRYLNDRLLLGASAAYTYTDVDQDKGRGDGDIEGWIASLYSNYSLDKAYVDGSVSYGQNDYDAKRKISIGPLTRTAKSNHDGDVIAASLGGGYLMPVNDSVLEPFGRLRYIRLEEDAFTESGADSVNQQISSRNIDSLTSEIGLRVSRIYQKATGLLTADASVAWQHDFDIDDRTITTSYTGAPASSFSMPGQDVERNGVTLGLGVGFETKKGVSTSLNYNGEFRDGFSAHGIIGRISYRF